VHLNETPILQLRDALRRPSPLSGLARSVTADEGAEFADMLCAMEKGKLTEQ